MYTRYTRYGDPVRLSSESRAPDPTWSTLALAGATGKTSSASTGLLAEQDAPFRVREALAANGSRTPALLPSAGRVRKSAMCSERLRRGALIAGGAGADDEGMPDPREAVYDVLKAKAERAREQRRRDDATTADGTAWVAYQQANEAAHSSYRARTR